MNVPALLLALTLSPSAPPPCWIRGDPADLQLRISPLDSAVTTLGADTVTLCYSRPRKLGRPVMGRLVPFGQPWRLGANEATTLHTPVPLRVGNVPVAPGSYSLYAIPDSAQWRIVVNSGVGRWGIPISDEVRREDLGETAVPVERVREAVEMFTMRFERIGADALELVIEWERTRVRVPIRRGAP